MITTMARANIGMMLAVVALVAACGRAPAPSGTNDPYESTNRAWFERNLALMEGFTPEPETGMTADAPAEPPSPRHLFRLVGNFGANLGLPSTILNDLLQIRPDRAAENAIRMVVNSTIGLGGLFDPAGRLGIHGRRSDFGETLHRWGVGEGAYVVLPFFGPSTERDSAGLVVDMLTNPLRFALPNPEYGWSTAARLAGRLAEAAEYSDIFDANVINTADPYAQARLLYLQTRRYHLGIETEDEIIDPYADF